MAAVTGDAPEMEGPVGTTGVSSAVQAAVAFYPPTNFLTMDAWAVQKCDGAERATTARARPNRGSWAVPSRPARRRCGRPARCSYITPADPPIMILHGNSDQLVPHNQGEQLYMALNKACKDAVFISLPEGSPRELERIPDRRRAARGGDDALDLGRRLHGGEPDALHADVEDGDRVPGQVHEMTSRPGADERVRGPGPALASVPTGPREAVHVDARDARRTKRDTVSGVREDACASRQAAF